MRSVRRSAMGETAVSVAVLLAPTLAAPAFAQRSTDPRRQCVDLALRRRHRVAATHAGQLGVGLVGVGLHLAPFRQGLATLRLDVSVPVVHSPGVRGRPFVALSISPWLTAGRQHPGRAPR